MGGIKGSGWKETMKWLGKVLEEQFLCESRDIGVSLDSYSAMWKAAYAFIADREKREPSRKEVKDGVRIFADYVRNKEHCRLKDQEEYSEHIVQELFVVDSNGLRCTQVKRVSKEAEVPPLHPLFHILHRRRSVIT